MFYVRTIDGHVTANGRTIDKAGTTTATLTRAEAEADASARNTRAEAVGIKTRYEAVEFSA